ncbi:coq1 putative hexaprenyl diphosphate synthase [Puccinia graminis f. sp. tritici]|uniref:(2E,6E)-farnesyl diphosphate synthase n=1 Tax=Puccinia graminis f. sp. tritici TaxID=56615 RepID=A0A5B0PYB0_PUCGR|nr:coq1 putative hexaprenyl diphosphate synthase [Puccinia graminis f. sp. tritici]KAA1121033.1 coq1 putative hexaprenyl diphosphate synthase [Puccinia graminis f. sp. tritici]
MAHRLPPLLLLPRLTTRQLSTQPKTKLAPSLSILDLPSTTTHSLQAIVDPFELLANELSHLKQNIKALVGSDHLRLNSIAKYYLASAHQGKHLRPLVVLLISQATAAPPLADRPRPTNALHFIDRPISPPEILNDNNSSSDQQGLLPEEAEDSAILPAQRRLAEIAELIHVSSLLHDDVIDQAETRRGQASAPRQFGSKLSVLAGDFLLARASLNLARLRNFEVIELISSVISNLVEGELIQLESILVPHLQNPPKLAPSSDPSNLQSTSLSHSPAAFDPRLFDFYMRKNYLKTASLIAKTCRAAVILSSSSSSSSPPSPQTQELIEASYQFGKHLGLAFQIVDDILDYTGSEDELGKTGNGSDLKAGLITGPGLFAWKQFDRTFGELVVRKFCRPGDLDLAKEMVHKSDAIRSSYQLASHHIQLCLSQLNSFNDSDAKAGLQRLCDLVLNRNH